MVFLNQIFLTMKFSEFYTPGYSLKKKNKKIKKIKLLRMVSLYYFNINRNVHSVSLCIHV